MDFYIHILKNKYLINKKMKMSFAKYLILVILIINLIMTKGQIIHDDLRILENDSSTSNTDGIKQPLVTVEINNDVDFDELSENFEKENIQKGEFIINVKVENTANQAKEK